MNEFNKLAICCMSGGYKNVFTHGVLRAFEDYHMKAEAYASCSSSVLIAAFATLGNIKALDLSLWSDGYQTSQKEGNQSEAMLESIRRVSGEIKNHLWSSQSSRLLVATSRVKTEEAALVTQSDGAKRLGQMLLINSLRHKPEWKDVNLELRLFDTKADDKACLLTSDNFEEVAYATTRMLHAWKIPAYIEKEPYIDGSYTSMCPLVPLSELGYEKIICISPEKGKVTSDLFSEEEIPQQLNGRAVDFIKPDCELKEMGVDFYSVSPEGLAEVYKYGYEKGKFYIESLK